jgi:2-oxo-4-hydroxy-4-carboxy-5-ureidoimidazoline decarboxylase
MLSLAQLNSMPAGDAADQLRTCCGSSRWVDSMLARRPFPTVDSVLAAADQAWRATGPTDWDEAFSHHPKIGERQAAAPVSATARAWSVGEQRGVTQASSATRAALAEANQAYQRRFGRIYIVCAAGRSAEELLADIERRMENEPELERAVAAEEQRKITALRLRSLLGAPEP